MSTGFAQLAAAPNVATADPSKHVNYTFGMLLGVDDFNQEFAYLAGRDQWLARDLFGYGTLCGLRVSLDKTAKGPRVSITSGTALSPRGQLICVRPAQCAYLNDWLKANEQAVQQFLSSPLGSSVKLYLVLCYRDCPVDPVPIAGEPCRSADDLMAPSRLIDDFRLELRLSPPAQLEEDAIRDFVAWMSQIEIADGAGPFTTLADFEKALRGALAPMGSPPDPGMFFQFGSPLAGIRIHSSDVCAYMQLAFRIWVTEMRPLFRASWPSAGCSCGPDSGIDAPPSDECLLLAEIDVPVINVGPGQNWQVDDLHPVTLDESRRPILLHTRLLQEWLLCGPNRNAPWPLIFSNRF
jgi:hypothetical protein